MLQEFDYLILVEMVFGEGWIVYDAGYNDYDEADKRAKEIVEAYPWWRVKLVVDLELLISTARHYQRRVQELEAALGEARGALGFHASPDNYSWYDSICATT